jgi:hypothetical protein
MNSQPQLLATCKEFDQPEEWKRCKDSQLVNLGSGKFCIARFFHNKTPQGDSDELIGKNITVLTGVEVVPSVYHANGNDNSRKGELQMGNISYAHRPSRVHTCTPTKKYHQKI